MVIYLVTNTINGKYYVGKTVHSAEYRWAKHLNDAKNGSTVLFHKALRKYGADAFEVQTLTTATNNEQLRHLETLWIISLRSYDRSLGYNITMGGEGVMGLRHSEETRKKMRAAKVGRTLSAEHKAKIGKAVQHARIADPTLTERISTSNIGKHTPSPEYKAKMILASKNRGRDAQYRQKIADSLLGRVDSDELKARKSAAQKKRWAERRAADPNYRKHQSDDVRKKLSDAKKLFWASRKDNQCSVEV